MDTEKLAMSEKAIVKGNYSKYWVSLLVFIVVSWPPFYGYTFLKSYLDGFGFESTHFSIDIQEAIWFFFAGISDLWSGLPKFINWLFNYSLSLGILVFFLVFIGLSVNKKTKVKLTKITKNVYASLVDWLNRHHCTKVFLLSIISAFCTSLLVYSIFIFLLTSLTLVFLFSILGDIYGGNEAGKELIKNQCIYAPFDSDCPKIEIDGDKKSGLVVYSNEKSTFFATSDGRYQLNDKGRVVQFRPFKISQINGLGSETFIPEKWMANIKDRSAMLNDFIANNKDNLTAELVFKSLGDSDVKFHYKEFPAYRLSSTSTCSVGFPFNWETKEIVNVVQFGNCKN